MAKDKEFIYFPSLSTFVGVLKQPDTKKITDLSYRFYTDEYGKFKHPFFLLTAGALYKKMDIRKELGMENTLVFGDSGGYQIATGALKWNVNLRENIFNWLEANSDIAMNIDIPPVTKNTSFQDCIDLTVDNMKWFEKHQSGKTDFLNVLQIYDDKRTMQWYDAVKGFKEFNGWGIGSKNATVVNFCKIICLFLKNREFESKNFKWFHFLGKTSIPHFFLYAVLQKNLNKHYPHVHVTTDSSTPAKQPVFGNYYHSINYKSLGFVNLYYGNKGKTNYITDAKLPCTIDCPICHKITFDNIANGESLTMVRDLMAWHNLFLMIKGANDISTLANAHFEIFEGMMPRDFYLILKSINDMFTAGDEAERVFTNNLPLYQKFDVQYPQTEDESDEDIFG